MSSFSPYRIQEDSLQSYSEAVSGLSGLKRVETVSDRYKNAIESPELTPQERINTLIGIYADKEAESIKDDFVTHGLLECKFIKVSQDGYVVNFEIIPNTKRLTQIDKLQYLITAVLPCLTTDYEIIFRTDYAHFEKVSLDRNTEQAQIKLVKFLAIFGILQIKNDTVNKFRYEPTLFGKEFLAELHRRSPMSILTQERETKPFFIRVKEEFITYCVHMFVIGTFLIILTFIIYICWGVIFPPIKRRIPEQVKVWLNITNTEYKDDLKFLPKLPEKKDE